MKPTRANLKASPLSNPEQSREHALQQILQLRETAASLAQEATPSTFLEGAYQICQLRSAIYEDLNQFPHEVLVLETQRQLAMKLEFQDLEWHWHPRQTSGECETDLMGWRGDQLIVVAEANTSSQAKGVIKKRIAKAIDNLVAVEHPAEMYFYCYSESCAVEAIRLINNKHPGKAIKVVTMALGPSA